MEILVKIDDRVTHFHYIVGWAVDHAGSNHVRIHFHTLVYSIGKPMRWIHSTDKVSASSRPSFFCSVSVITLLFDYNNGDVFPYTIVYIQRRIVSKKRVN